MLAKAKAQGMYPTPTLLVRRLIEDLFDTYKSAPTSLLEPSAGNGIFIIETWDYWFKERRLSRTQMKKMVSNTHAFENDSETFKCLKETLNNWCKKNKILAEPKIKKENFILNIDRYTNTFDDLVVLGNPPWDEFTTRKHDSINFAIVKHIRNERNIERVMYSSQGVKNLYQAFLVAILKIQAKSMRMLFVLPRQILGDMSSSFLRNQLITTGNTKFTVYKNKEETDYYFDAVDSNFEIAILDYNRKTKYSNIEKSNVWIRRGFNSEYQMVKPTGLDNSFPCSPKSELTPTLNKMLATQSFGDWCQNWGISISRGKVLPQSKYYTSSRNGKTITAYEATREIKNSLLVINKILPNSKRKIKAALVPNNDRIADSLVMVESLNKQIYPYLILMLNSRAVELSLWSLTTNINLNNFRLMSLPIPEPDEKILRLANKYYTRCLSGGENWETASDLLTAHIYDLSSKDKKMLENLFPTRIIDFTSSDAAA